VRLNDHPYAASSHTAGARTHVPHTAEPFVCTTQEYSASRTPLFFTRLQYQAPGGVLIDVERDQRQHAHDRAATSIHGGRVMIRKLHRKQGAQSLVEFALIMPMFFILVFGVIDFGMGLRAYISLSQATREGARYGIVGNTGGGSGTCISPPANTVRDKVCDTLDGLNLDSGDTVAVTYPTGNVPGESIHVVANYEYDFITPLDLFVNVLSGGSMSSSIDISSTTDMRIE